MVCFLHTDISSDAAENPEPTTPEYGIPMIRCYCNLPECLAASGGVPTCTTRLGCFSELKPISFPNNDGTTAPSTSLPVTIVPIPSEFDDEMAASMVVDEEALRAKYGCLELIPM